MFLTGVSETVRSCLLDPGAFLELGKSTLIFFLPRVVHRPSYVEMSTLLLLVDV
jgi:hypothetical protein